MINNINVKKYYIDSAASKSLDCEKISVNGNVFIAKFNGVDSIEMAECYRGVVLFANRSDLNIEEGSYFIQDILDCRVLDAETGNLYGVICDVSATGANDVWHIKNNDKEYLIPVIPSVVKSVDIDKGEIKIIALEGIFDDED